MLYMNHDDHHTTRCFGTQTAQKRVPMFYMFERCYSQVSALCIIPKHTRKHTLLCAGVAAVPSLSGARSCVFPLPGGATFVTGTVGCIRFAGCRHFDPDSHLRSPENWPSTSPMLGGEGRHCEESRRSD